MRLASHNVENMFDRHKALNQESVAERLSALQTHRALNALFNKDNFRSGQTLGAETAEGAAAGSKNNGAPRQVGSCSVVRGIQSVEEHRKGLLRGE